MNPRHHLSHNRPSRDAADSRDPGRTQGRLHSSDYCHIQKKLLCCQNVSGSVVVQKLQKSVITVNTCSRASRDKIFTPLVVSDAVCQKHCLLPILSCDAHRLLNAAIPSKAIANAGLSRHRHSPAGGLLKCLVLPAGFGAKHILYYVQERKIMNFWEPQRRRQQQWWAHRSKYQ